MKKYFFDLFILLCMGPVVVVPFVICSLVVKLTSKGPIFHWSSRVGKNNLLFQMPKFRTMYVNTPQVATHLLQNPKACLTPVGSFLRKTSLDEIPQLWCILTGKMSFVGPRPALFNQDDLIELRTQYGIEKLTPGLTGWAQINGRDELPIPQKVELDKYYLDNHSLKFDLQIILKTAKLALWDKSVSH